MKKSVFAVALLLGVFAVAGTIKTWSSGEALTASDLNNNFAHIHNLMVGGHGARLVNADVAPNAAISLSKIAGSSAFPKAWAYKAQSTCSAGAYPTTCSTTGSQVTTVSNNALGSYNVTLSYTPTDASFAVIVSAVNAGGTNSRVCDVRSLQTTAPHFNIRCSDVATPTSFDTGFNFIVMDDN